MKLPGGSWTNFMPIELVKGPGVSCPPALDAVPKTNRDKVATHADDMPHISLSAANDEFRNPND
jgi:hypothetical protein